MKLTHISRHLTFVFFNCSLEDIPTKVLQKIVWGKVTAVFCTAKEFIRKEYRYQISDEKQIDKDEEENDDHSSSDEEDLKEHKILLFGGYNMAKKISLLDDHEWNIENFMV